MRMRDHSCQASIVALMLLVLPSLAWADSLSVSFDSPINGYPMPAPSLGTLSLVLNQDGSISGTLSAISGISGFGFNFTTGSVSISGLPSNYSVTQFGTLAGTFYGAIASDAFLFYNFSLPQLSSFSFIVTTPGGFSSVSQLAVFAPNNIPPNPPVHFWLLLYDGQTVAQAGAITPIPEPTSLILFATGLCALRFLQRKAGKK